MNLDSIYIEAAVNLGLDQEEVKKAYKFYWKFIRDTIANLPLKGNLLTEEEFNKIKHSFNISRIGKLNISYKRYKKYRPKRI